MKFISFAAAAALLVAAPVSAQAGGLYAWVIARETCERIGYGLSFDTSYRQAFGEVLSNSIYAADWRRDHDTGLPNGWTLAHVRIAREIAKACGSIAVRATK